MPDEFEEKLRGIGFDFNDDSGARGNRLTWSERYVELLDYKEKNGNCDIASSGTNNEHHALHVWVHAMLSTFGSLLKDCIGDGSSEENQIRCRMKKKKNYAVLVLTLEHLKVGENAGRLWLRVQVRRKAPRFFRRHQSPISSVTGTCRSSR